MSTRFESPSQKAQREKNEQRFKTPSFPTPSEANKYVAGKSARTVGGRTVKASPKTYSSSLLQKSFTSRAAMQQAEAAEKARQEEIQKQIARDKARIQAEINKLNLVRAYTGRDIKSGNVANIKD